MMMEVVNSRWVKWATLTLAFVVAIAVPAGAYCPPGEVCGRRSQAAFVASPIKGMGPFSRSLDEGTTVHNMGMAASSVRMSVISGMSRAESTPQRMMASDMSSAPKRRHLGPTTEDIVSSRRAEKEQLRRDVAALRATAVAAQGETEAEEEDLKPANLAAATRSTTGGRHLGPSLDQINQMRADACAARRASLWGPEPGKQGALAVEEEEHVVASNDDSPTMVQFRALERHGVEREDMPNSKAGAADMLRTLREVHIANALGCQLDAEDFKGGSGHSNRGGKEEAEAVVHQYSPAHRMGAGHLEFALQGISSIRRDGAISSTNVRKPQ